METDKSPIEKAKEYRKQTIKGEEKESDSLTAGTFDEASYYHDEQADVGGDEKKDSKDQKN